MNVSVGVDIGNLMTVETDLLDSTVIMLVNVGVGNGCGIPCGWQAIVPNNKNPLTTRDMNLFMDSTPAKSGCK